MKILYIAHERMLGGASISLMTLADEMQKKGHSVAVVVPFYFSPLAKELRKRKIKTYWVFNGWWMMPSTWPPYLKCVFRVLYMLEAIPAYIIGKIVKRKGFQIVHSNSSTIDVGSKAAKLAGVQHVWHFREFADIFYDLEYLKGKEASLDSIINGTDYIVFISKCLQKYYDILERTGRTKVIYNGIDKKYLNYHIHDNREKVIFLISGNLHRNKRQDLILHAILLLRQWTMDGFELWIAGGAGSTRDSLDYAKELQRFIEINKMKEVKLLGRVQDMNKIRRKADVEIVSSTIEAFGRVTIEAMLSANPVLASDSGANPELVQDGKNGWIFKCGDAEDLAEKMKKIICNPKMIETMGDFAYHFAENQFLSDRNTDSIEKLYEELLEDPGKHGKGFCGDDHL